MTNTKGRLGAYIPITSASGPFGFNPTFATTNGWDGQADDQVRRILEGRFATATVWRPHGDREALATPSLENGSLDPRGRNFRGRGAMPLDAMLYLDPMSFDPTERAAADERAFIRYLTRLKNALDDVAGGPGMGELWVYLGNLTQAGNMELALNARSTADRKERIRRVMHPLLVADVDGVVIDAAGPAKSNSLESQTCKMLLDMGFKRVGYEGWAEKGKSEHWITDQRHTGFLMAYWASDAERFYAAKEMVRGGLAYINCGEPNERAWSKRTESSIAFIAKAKDEGIDVYLDIWSATNLGITPAKGY